MCVITQFTLWQKIVFHCVKWKICKTENLCVKAAKTIGTVSLLNMKHLNHSLRAYRRSKMIQYQHNVLNSYWIKTITKSNGIFQDSVEKIIQLLSVSVQITSDGMGKQLFLPVICKLMQLFSFCNVISIMSVEISKAGHCKYLLIC